MGKTTGATKTRRGKTKSLKYPRNLSSHFLCSFFFSSPLLAFFSPFHCFALPSHETTISSPTRHGTGQYYTSCKPLSAFWRMDKAIHSKKTKSKAKQNRIEQRVSNKNHSGPIFTSTHSAHENTLTQQKWTRKGWKIRQTWNRHGLRINTRWQTRFIRTKGRFIHPPPLTHTPRLLDKFHFYVDHIHKSLLKSDISCHLKKKKDVSSFLHSPEV